MKKLRSPNEDAEVRRYLPMVRRIAGSLLRGVPPDVTFDELVSAGLVGLLSALRQDIRRLDTFDSYVAVAVQWAILDWCRTTRSTPRAAWKQGIRVLVCGRPWDYPTDEPSPEERADLQSMLRMLKDLPEREAKILVWAYLDDVPCEEIATRLGISQPRVSQLKAQALARMRKRLKEAA